MPMKNPPHPGVVVLQECIEPSGLTITQAAEALGVTRNTLSELVNGKRGISPEMAVRIAKVFGGTEEGWLIQQAQYELATFAATASNSNGWKSLKHERPTTRELAERVAQLRRCPCGSFRVDVRLQRCVDSDA